jgi:hypothetical protein
MNDARRGALSIYPSLAVDKGFSILIAVCHTHGRSGERADMLQQPTEDTLFKHLLQKRHNSQFSGQVVTVRKEIRFYP